MSRRVFNLFIYDFFRSKSSFSLFFIYITVQASQCLIAYLNHSHPNLLVCLGCY